MNLGFNSSLSKIKESSSMKRGGIMNSGALNLAIGTPDLSPPSELTEIISRFKDGPNYRYGNSRGSLKTRQKVLELIDSDSSWIEPEKHISIVSGAKYGIYLSLKTLCNVNDSVFIIEPYWLSYPDICSSLGLKWNSIKPEGERFNAAEVIQSLNNPPKVIIVNTPNNPSGEIYNHTELDYLAQYCEASGIWLIIDEVYKDLAFNPKAETIMKNYYSNVIRVGSFSKSLAIPGMRIGYVFGSELFISKFNLFHQHILTCANSLSEFIIEEVSPSVYRTFCKSSSKEYSRRFKEFKRLLGIQYSIIESQSTFYAMIDVSSRFRNGDEAVQQFEKKNIIVTSGKSYGDSYTNFVRVCLTFPVERMHELKKLL